MREEADLHYDIKEKSSPKGAKIITTITISQKRRNVNGNLISENSRNSR